WLAQAEIVGGWLKFVGTYRLRGRSGCGSAVRRRLRFWHVWRPSNGETDFPKPRTANKPSGFGFGLRHLPVLNALTGRMATNKSEVCYSRRWITCKELF